MTDLLPDLAPTTIDPASLPSVAPNSPEEALSWLGETVEEVAEGLRARGIKGNRTGRASANCPLARYLRVWWPGTHVALGYTDLCYDLDEDGRSFRNSPACIEFERLYDSGAFPDLVDD